MPDSLERDAARAAAASTRATAIATAVVIPVGTLALYLCGASLTPPGKSFLWMHALNTGDTYAYLSWVEQAREGRWLFRDLFTGEPCRALLIHPLFLLIGLLARATGLSAIAAFHVARTVLGALLLLALHRFFARRIGSAGAAAFALVYAAIGSGLGWLFVRPDLPALGLPVDLWMPEAIVFLTLLESPLFIAGLLLALLVYERLFAAEEARSARRDATLFGLALVLGLTHPFEVVSIAATTVAALALRGARLFEAPRGLARRALVFAAGGAVPLAYVRLVLGREPVFAHWLSVVRSPSPEPWSYAAAFAPQIVLALVALPIVLRRRSPADLLCIAWIIGTASLLYAPLAQQRRFVAGVQVPLTLLATIGLYDGLRPAARRAADALARVRWLARLAGRRARAAVLPILRTLFLAASFGTNATVIGADVAYFRRGEYPLYLERDLLAAIEAFGARASADALLLASPDVGHFAPGLTGRRVVAGHYDLTVDPPRKAAEIRRVLDARAPAGERRALLDRAGVTHVLLSPYEAAMVGREPTLLAGPDPLSFLGADVARLGLAPLFRSGPVTLYEVAR